MRILWVNTGGLWPLNTGGRLRSFNIIRELSRRHRVTLLTTHGPADAPGELVEQLEGCERVTSLPFAAPKQGTPRFVLALARSWLSPLPVNLRKWRIEALRSAVVRDLLAEPADVCIADFLTAVANVPLGQAAPLVLFEHNVEYRIWQRLARAESRAWRRALLTLEWRKTRRCEAAAVRRARLTLAVSEADRGDLQARVPSARVRAIPTGVDTAYFAPNGHGETPSGLVFTGSMDYYPNEEGLLHFMAAILPLVRRKAPGTTLTIVGRYPSQRLRDAAAECGVSVTGRVDDVRPYVSRAAVYVVPLRIGGGTRLKIFEALAMGKPVVSTTLGAEGLPLVDGEHFLRADDPESFAQSVVGLIKDAGRRQTLGGAGRRLVEQKFGWDRVAGNFESHLREVVTS